MLLFTSMENYGPETYGGRIAGIYDDLYGSVDQAAVDFLAEAAAGKPVLELGIGTGRVALPLKKRGLQIEGIDASPAMVEKLRKKEGGSDIPVTFGDFADINVSGRYGLIFVVFNTFFALLTQEDQLRCMKNVSAHLTQDGFFVIEAFVPDVARFTGGQTIRATRVDADRVQLDVSKHDPVTQQVTSQHLFCSDAGIETYPVVIRYAWPSELDMMARAAGMKLAQRYGDWDQAPFTAASGKHISLFARIAP